MGFFFAKGSHTRDFTADLITIKNGLLKFDNWLWNCQSPQTTDYHHKLPLWLCEWRLHRGKFPQSLQSHDLKCGASTVQEARCTNLHWYLPWNIWLGWCSQIAFQCSFRTMVWWFELGHKIFAYTRSLWNTLSSDLASVLLWVGLRAREPHDRDEMVSWRRSAWAAGRCNFMLKWLFSVFIRSNLEAMRPRPRQTWSEQTNLPTCQTTVCSLLWDYFLQAWGPEEMSDQQLQKPTQAGSHLNWTTQPKFGFGLKVPRASFQGRIPVRSRSPPTVILDLLRFLAVLSRVGTTWCCAALKGPRSQFDGTEQSKIWMFHKSASVGGELWWDHTKVCSSIVDSE